MTVRELLARCDSQELSEWMAYENITGPLGGERGDIHAAIIATTMANTKRTRQTAAKVSDFIPEWDRRPQSIEEQKAIMLTAIRGAGR